MTTPWLTVVMPTHDGARWLGEALASIAAEGDPGIACLVYDSSADEATVAVAERFRDRLDLTIERRRDLGPWTVKTNALVAAAATDHVAMLHQDDLWRPGRAAAMRAAIAAEPEAVLYLFATRIVDETGRDLGAWTCPLPEGRVARDLLVERLIVQNFVSVPAPVFRRDAFLAVGGLDPDLWYTADWDLWLKLAAAGPVTHHRRATAGFRIHGGSQTIAGSRSLDDFRDQMQRVLDRHGGSVEGPEATAALAAARVSIAINTALAGAADGKGAGLVGAGLGLLGLGPMGMLRYFRDSRLIERVMPRLRAKLGGRLTRTADAARREATA